MATGNRTGIFTQAAPNIGPMVSPEQDQSSYKVFMRY